MIAEELVRYARACVVAALGGPAAVRPEGPWTTEQHGTFVTLRWTDGRLQGCIGNLEPRATVVDDVAHNAVAAATLDPRAAPLAAGDLDDIDFEVSILSPLEPIPSSTEEEALAGLVPHRHGIVLARGLRRATFLPVMWSRFADGAALLHALKQKAGLPGDLWDEDVQVHRYTVDKHVGTGRGAVRRDRPPPRERQPEGTPK